MGSTEVIDGQKHKVFKFDDEALSNVKNKLEELLKKCKYLHFFSYYRIIKGVKCMKIVNNIDKNIFREYDIVCYIRNNIV